MNNYILAYPDNPVGTHFITAFLNEKAPLAGVIVETKAGGSNIKRLKKKIEHDGFFRAIYRTLQVFWLRFTRKNIVGLAEKNNIPVYRVERFNSKPCEELLQSLDIDLLIIASAPILKKYVFDKAKKGCLNSHPGWLPKYRGLGANAYAVKNGDHPGVTVHYIDAGIDTGPIILREEVPVYKGDTVAKINDRAVARGAWLMADVVNRLKNGPVDLLRIDEKTGENYRAMPYKDAKNVNRLLRNRGVSHAV